MSLGKYRGAALIGRPLDISVQAVLGAQDDPAALCIEADAFYADNRLDKSLVRISTEKLLSNPLDTLIRIRSSVPVDEPVVTLNVRAGCQQKTERRYVILADLASEPASLPVQPSVSAAGAGTSSLSASSATKSNSAVGTPAAPFSANPSNSTSTSPSVRLAASTPARRASARPVAALTGESNGGSNNGSSDSSSDGSNTATAGQTTASTSSKRNTSVAKRDKLQANTAGASGQNASGQARLKLEPLDLSIDHDPQLKPSTQLLSAPAPGEQRLAAAVLWRALAAQPQDIIKDAEKIQSLENSLNTLREQTQKNQLALNELNSQFEKTRSERYANWLVYVLGLLLVVALAGLVTVWRLRARTDTTAANTLPWWRKNKPLEKSWANNLPESDFPLSPPSPSSPTSPDVAFAEDSDLPNYQKKKKKDAKPVLLQNPESTLGADEPAFTEVRHMSSPDGDFQPLSSSSLDFTVSMPRVARSAKAEELFDVQQQADFFVSLGQHERAVKLLRGHIADNSQASPLVYMDLFDLYHQLERQTDYEALRADFNQLFTGKIPAFDSYTDLSAGLDAYPVALTRIEALWPSAKVLEVIEESVLRRPVSKADAFDLEAYRELLLLYAVAKELAQPQGSKDAGALQFDLPDTPPVTPPVTPSANVPSADASPEDSTAHLSEFSLTCIEPLSASTGNKATPDIDLLLPPQSPRLALDVDLDDLMGKTISTPSPNVGVQSNSNSNFFARLGTKMPVSSLTRSPAVAVVPVALPAVPPVAPYIPSADDCNLIDFDDLDAFIKNLDSPEPPKV